MLGYAKRFCFKFYSKYILGPVFTETPATETEPARTAAENAAVYYTYKDTEQANSVRADRNKRLTDTDWTQVDDAPVDKAAWATYRQALRDVPNQTGFPWDITWPTTP